MVPDSWVSRWQEMLSVLNGVADIKLNLTVHLGKLHVYGVATKFRFPWIIISVSL